MVEIRHDDFETFVFFAEEIGDGDGDVVEFNVRGTCDK